MFFNLKRCFRTTVLFKSPVLWRLGDSNTRSVTVDGFRQGYVNFVDELLLRNGDAISILQKKFVRQRISQVKSLRNEWKNDASNDKSLSLKIFLL